MGNEEKKAEQTPAPAQVYESKAPNRLISTAQGKLKFRPVVPGGFGVLKADEPLILVKTKLKPAQIEAIIERQEDFTGGVPGVAGIWRQEARVDAQANRSLGKIRAELLALGGVALRRKLAEAKIEYPVKATDDDLANLVLGAMASGKMGVAAAPDQAAADDEPARPARPNLRRGAARAAAADEE